MSNWMWVKNKLEHKLKVRRTDWGYQESAYIMLHEFAGVNQFYIYNQYSLRDAPETGYGITYSDLESNCWVLVE